MQRAILAERTVLRSSRIADELDRITLESIAKLLADLFSDFTPFKNKELGDAQKKISNLKAAKFDPSKRGFLGKWSESQNEVNDALKKLVEEKGQNGLASLSTVITIVRKSFNIYISEVKQNLQNNGDNESTISAVNALSTVFRTMLEVVENASLGGLFKTPVSTLIKNTVPQLHATLFDSSLGLGFSYCERTDDFLDFSLEKMKSWDVDNRTAFLQDRQEWNKILLEIDNNTTFVLALARAAKEAATGFGNTENAFAVASTTGVPVFKVLQKTAQFLEYLLTAVAADSAVLMRWFVLPSLTEDGVFAAYNSNSPSQRTKEEINQFVVAQAGESGGKASPQFLTSV